MARTSRPPKEREGREVEADIRREFFGGLERSADHQRSAHSMCWRSSKRQRTAVPRLSSLEPFGARQAPLLVGYREALLRRRKPPCDRIKARDILGKKSPRKRVLRDNEIRAVWQAAEATGYPYGPLFQLLLLTGARKSELACARWSEIDEERRVLIVPDERHKSKRGHVTGSAMPLGTSSRACLASRPAIIFFRQRTANLRGKCGFSKSEDSLDTATLAATA